MLKIYNDPVSLYCAKLRILLRHKNIEHQELDPPGGYGSAIYKTIIPSGNLPAMDDDGFVLSDSEAIAEYLNEKHIWPPMMPNDMRQRAKVRERGRFHDTRLEPGVRKLFPQVRPEARDGDVVGAVAQEIEARMEQMVPLFLRADIAEKDGLSDDLTLGDCGYVISLAIIETLTPVLDLRLTWPDEVALYHKRLCAIPACADVLKDYRATLQGWLVSLDAV